jgi:electron transfer flavoprotein beta subunit
MKAKKKPVAKRALESLGIDIHSRLDILKMAEPPRRKAGVKVASVTELINKLKTEAGVLQ